jgi:uncharacterized protein (TIGR00304 family)
MKGEAIKALFDAVLINIYGSKRLMGQVTLAALGFALIILGFIITFAAALIMLIKAVPLKKKAKGGGLIMIGPIPIIFGTDKETMKILIILAIVLMVFAVIVMFIPYLVR